MEESKKEKKSFLLNMNDELFTKFKELCDKEGNSITIGLKQIMKLAIKKQSIWK